MSFGKRFLIDHFVTVDISLVVNLLRQKKKEVLKVVLIVDVVVVDTNIFQGQPAETKPWQTQTVTNTMAGLAFSACKQHSES